MKRNTVLLYNLAIVLMLLMTACNQSSSGAGTAPTTIPTVVADTHIVAEGRIVPREEVYLSFFSSGQVSEILVEEGVTVKTGDVVARLGNREGIETAIANAQAELLSAQQARDALNEGVEYARAAAVRAISEANIIVRDAQYKMDNFTIPASQKGLNAQEAVVKMKEILDASRAAFEAVKFLPSNNTTRKSVKEELDSAQSDYNAAVRRLEYETTLNEAQARLDKAVQDSEALANGPDPDQISSVNARIDAAEAAVRSAKAALTNLDLVATIDGLVVEQNLVVGQTVAPGQPVMRIADFSKRYVETSDLTELEVVEIQLDQKASIVADALPEVSLNGIVEKISDVYEEKRGEITYTVRILLTDYDPRLRWGMTVEVTFEK